MNRYIPLINEAIQATWIYPPARFSWFGERSPKLRHEVRDRLDPQVARSHLLRTLQATLYSHFYCTGGAVPQRDSAYLTSPSAGFAERLSAANCGTGCWEAGWQADAQATDGLPWARKGPLRIQVSIAGCRPAIPFELLKPGTAIEVRLPKENRFVSPGYYMALGNGDWGADGPANGAPQHLRLLRIYWNLRPTGAVEVLAGITRLLNEISVPFRFKAVDNPRGYDRCDSGVLYIRRADYPHVKNLLEQVYTAACNVGGLNRRVPALTLQLAPGLGLAEDPANGESFGQRVTRLLAEGLLRADESCTRTVQTRLAFVRQCFEEAGVDLEAPYLELRDHVHEYEKIGGTLPRVGRLATETQTKPERTASTMRYGATYARHVGEQHDEKHYSVCRDVALAVGEELIQSAIWWKSMCVWLDPEPVAESSRHSVVGKTSPQGAASVAYETIGPDLYSGTAGVALFLTELYVATGDTRARSTALGALRHALAQADYIPPPGRCGYYTGWIGIAVASVRIGRRLEDRSLVEDGLQLAIRCANSRYEPSALDLLTGAAGAVAGCIILQDLTGPNIALQTYLVRLGKRLADEISTRVLVPGNRKGEKLLTGFSHGAAGIGYALLEMWRFLGDVEYRKAAEHLFAFERACFSAAAGNWPDFRFPPVHDKRGHLKRPCSVAWCHGAGGIALSRLRAWEITREEVYRDEARMALATIAGWLQDNSVLADASSSLCHGTLGNVAVVWEGAYTLGLQSSDVELLAASTVDMSTIGSNAMAQGYTLTRGSRSGKAPGLMTGLAGIGLFCLTSNGMPARIALTIHTTSVEDKCPW